MQAPGKLLVGVTIADEDGVELERLADESGDVGDQLVGDAAAAEEGFGDLATRQIQRVNSDCRTSLVQCRLKVQRKRKIEMAQDRFRESCIAEIGRAEFGRVEHGAAEVRSAKVSAAEIGPAQIATAEVGPAEVGPSQVGPAEVCPAEIRFSEIRAA